MVDAPERIWVGTDGPQPDYEVWELEQSGSTEYVRADLYEQVKRERDEARSDHEWMRDNRNKWQDATARERNRAEAAERLAGARVKALIVELKQATHYDCIPSKTENAIDNAITYLSALAEPAGEAEPLSAQIERLASFIMEHVPGEPSQSEGAVDCAIRIIRNSLTTPPASAIREARKFQLGERVTKVKGSKWTGRVVGFYSTALTPVGYAVESETETGSVQIYPEAALTGAKP